MIGCTDHVTGAGPPALPDWLLQTLTDRAGLRGARGGVKARERECACACGGLSPEPSEELERLSRGERCRGAAPSLSEAGCWRAGRVGLGWRGGDLGSARPRSTARGRCRPRLSHHLPPSVPRFPFSYPLMHLPILLSAGTGPPWVAAHLAVSPPPLFPARRDAGIGSLPRYRVKVLGRERPGRGTRDGAGSRWLSCSGTCHTCERRDREKKKHHVVSLWPSRGTRTNPAASEAEFLTQRCGRTGGRTGAPSPGCRSKGFSGPARELSPRSCRETEGLKPAGGIQIFAKRRRKEKKNLSSWVLLIEQVYMRGYKKELQLQWH